MSADAALIALDWGTSSLRAYLLDAQGAILDRHQSAEGIRHVPEGDFAAAFRRITEGWDEQLPAIACGMIGSRNGWFEVSYCDAPADAAALARALERGPEGAPAGSPQLWIVPGVRCIDAHGDPDVMRGEETQLIGAALAGSRDGLFVHPGTHSKWARMRDGRILDFTTWMTGEMHAVLLGHSILGAFGKPPPAPSTPTDAGFDWRPFERGVARALAGGDFLHALFSARSRVLEADLPADLVPEYLSGLLIGEELRGAREAQLLAHAPRVVLIGDERLVARYARALGRLDIEVELGPPDVVVPALHAIARAAGLMISPGAADAAAPPAAIG